MYLRAEDSLLALNRQLVTIRVSDFELRVQVTAVLGVYVYEMCFRVRASIELVWVSTTCHTICVITYRVTI